MAAFCLRLADAFHLPFLADGGLDLCEDAQHLHKSAARRRAGVERLLGGTKGDVLLFTLSHNSREIRDRAGEAVNAGHSNHVSGSCKVDQGPKFHPTLGGRAAFLLLATNLILSIPQSFDVRPRFAPMNSSSYSHRSISRSESVSKGLGPRQRAPRKPLEA